METEGKREGRKIHGCIVVTSTKQSYGQSYMYLCKNAVL